MRRKHSSNNLTCKYNLISTQRRTNVFLASILCCMYETKINLKCSSFCVIILFVELLNVACFTTFFFSFTSFYFFRCDIWGNEFNADCNWLRANCEQCPILRVYIIVALYFLYINIFLTWFTQVVDLHCIAFILQTFPFFAFYVSFFLVCVCVYVCESVWVCVFYGYKYLFLFFDPFFFLFHTFEWKWTRIRR